MKTLFINPNSTANTTIPNMSLAYAATHFNVRVIDFNTKPEPRDRFLDQKADVLGISIQSRTFTEAKRIQEQYKKKCPKAKVVSVNTGVDVQCCYPFLAMKENMVFDKEFSDEYPFPNYELFDSFDLFLKNWQEGKWRYVIMTSLGCPFQCTYCKARARKWRSRSAENCFEELKQAKKRWKINSFEIIDDCFNLNKNRVIEFCGLIKNLKLKWHCVNGLRADLFDEDMAKAMKDSGCDYVGFGIESADPEVLKAIKKGETIEQIEQAIDIAKKHFKSVSGYFIIGLPESSYEKDLESLRWAVKKRINAHFSYYVPFDKASNLDNLFYGEKSQPLSGEYPKELQKRIYDMSAYMRDISTGAVGKVFTSFKSILRHDATYLPSHIVSGLGRMSNNRKMK